MKKLATPLLTQFLGRIPARGARKPNMPGVSTGATTAAVR
jgi:hypothetical protein